MTEEHVELSAWGLAEDLIEETDTGPATTKYLLGLTGKDPVAIADHAIREVVDRPKVTPWLRDSQVVGVFALRGDVYSLTDPLGEGKIRRVAVVLEEEGRYLAVGLDEMSGVQSITDTEWKELESTKLSWAKRVWDNGKQAYIELQPALYIESMTNSASNNS